MLAAWLIGLVADGAAFLEVKFVITALRVSLRSVIADYRDLWGERCFSDLGRCMTCSLMAQGVA